VAKRDLLNYDVWRSQLLAEDREADPLPPDPLGDMRGRWAEIAAEMDANLAKRYDAEGNQYGRPKYR
jgi:hypothetical protein